MYLSVSLIDEREKKLIHISVKIPKSFGKIRKYGNI